MKRELGAFSKSGAPAPVTISTLGPEFLQEVTAIDREWNPRPWGETLFKNEFDNNFARLIGIFSGEDLAGYLLAHLVLDEAHIVSFGIASSHRRQRLGSVLLDETLRRWSREGVQTVTLEVRPSNLAARALYEQFGFMLSGVRRRYYSDNLEDALSLRLQCWDYEESRLIKVAS